MSDPVPAERAALLAHLIAMYKVGPLSASYLEVLQDYGMVRKLKSMASFAGRRGSSITLGSLK